MYPLYMQQIKLFNCILKLMYLYQKERIQPLFVTHTFFLHEVFRFSAGNFRKRQGFCERFSRVFGVKVGRDG